MRSTINARIFSLLLFFIPSVVCGEALRVKWIVWEKEGLLTLQPQWKSTQMGPEIFGRPTYQMFRGVCQACSDWQITPASDDDVDKKCTSLSKNLLVDGKSTKKFNQMFKMCRDSMTMDADAYDQKYSVNHK